VAASHAVGLPVLAGFLPCTACCRLTPALLAPPSTMPVGSSHVVGLVVGVIAATLADLCSSRADSYVGAAGSFLRRVLPQDAVLARWQRRRRPRHWQRCMKAVLARRLRSRRTSPHRPSGSASGSARDPAACGADSPGGWADAVTTRELCPTASCISPVFPMCDGGGRAGRSGHAGRRVQEPAYHSAGGLRRLTVDAFTPIASRW